MRRRFESFQGTTVDQLDLTAHPARALADFVHECANTRLRRWYGGPRQFRIYRPLSPEVAM